VSGVIAKFNAALGYTLDPAGDYLPGRQCRLPNMAPAPCRPHSAFRIRYELDRHH